MSNRLTRRGFLATSGSAAAMAAALPQIAFAQDNTLPGSLLREAETTLEYRSWGSNPPEVQGAHRFLDANPDSAVNWINVNFGKFRDTLTTEFVSGSNLDVTTIPETELSGWAEAGFLLPIDDMPGYDKVVDNAVRAAIGAGQGLDGKHYSIPYTTDPFAWVYNRKMLNDAGFDAAPKNLDEIREQMVAIKKAGIKDFPLHLGMKQEPGQMWSLWCFVFGSGGRMFDEENNPVFDGEDDTLKNVLEWYVAAVNDWKIVGPEDLGHNWGDGRNAMKQGQIAGGCLARWALRFANLDEDSSVRGDVYMGKMPGLETDDIATVGSLHQIGIAANSKNPELAWEYIYHLSGPERDDSYRTQRERCIAFGGRATYMPVFEHPDYIEMVKSINNGETENFDKISQIVKQKEAVKTFWYPEWEAHWMQQMQDVITKSTDIDSALKSSAERARQLARS